MSRIRTVIQTGTKTTAVTCNAYDSIIQTVPLTDSADTSFVFTVNNDVVQDIATVLLTPIYPALNGYSTKTVTVTGSSGTANIAIAGVNYLATFNTDLTTTASDWVTLHGATLLALGYTVTSALAVITVKALTASFPTATITNATGNLAGTLGTVTATATTGNVAVNVVSQTQGSFVVRVTNISASALNCYASFAFKITHN